MRPPRRRPRRRPGDDAGFSLVEIVAATTILIVIVISLSNLLVDSLTSSLVARQREAAASLASDAVENSKAIGQAALTTASTASTSGCRAPGFVMSPAPIFQAVNTGTTPTTVATQPNPPQDGACLFVPYGVKLDTTTYTVTESLATSTTSADTITVSVTWPGASGTLSYTTNSQVGE